MFHKTDLTYDTILMHYGPMYIGWKSDDNEANTYLFGDNFMGIIFQGFRQ